MLLLLLLPLMLSVCNSQSFCFYDGSLEVCCRLFMVSASSSSSSSKLCRVVLMMDSLPSPNLLLSGSVWSQGRVTVAVLRDASPAAGLQAPTSRLYIYCKTEPYPISPATPQYYKTSLSCPCLDCKLKRASSCTVW